MPKQQSTRKIRTSMRKSEGRVIRKSRKYAENPAISLEDRKHYYELAIQQIITSLPDILQGLIEKAKSGGFQQAKLLLDMCDVTNMDPSQMSYEHTQQLCDVLLEGLRLPAAHVGDSKPDDDIH